MDLVRTLPSPEDPLATLLNTYNELNSSAIDELSSEPSALEFMRYVSLNRPFVVRGAAREWKATQNWNIASLKEKLEGTNVNVAVTPFGNADSATLDKDGTLLFVKPHEEQQEFTTFINYISAQEVSGSTEGEVRYAQTQNDNLRNEYSSLFQDVQTSIPFARIALQQPPEAINLWIGNSLSVTSLHKDNYENIYVQITGEKDFVLFPPICFPAVGERVLRPGSYVRAADGEGKDGLVIEREEGDGVMWACWDPDDSENGSEEENKKISSEVRNYRSLVQPMRVTLSKGDMLYLPRLWYHKVSQRCDQEGICIAVNYWHDMEFGGSFYPLSQFVRNVALAGQASRT